MTTYTAKSYQIKAYKFSAEARGNKNDWPKWLQAANKLGQADFGAVHQVGASQTWVIVSTWGRIVIPVDHFIICGADGGLDVMSPEELDEKFTAN